MDDEPNNSNTASIYMSRRGLYDIIKTKDNSSFQLQCSYLRQLMQERTNCPQSYLPTLNRILSRFTSEFKKRWTSSHRVARKFVEKHKVWLDSQLVFPKYTDQKTSFNQKKKGRPLSDFSDLSDQAKRLRTRHIRSMASMPELAYATQMSMRSSGQKDAAKLVKEVTFTTPTRALKYRSIFKNAHKRIMPLSGEEALSMFVEAKLTKHQYNIVRSKLKNLIPSYKVLQNIKKSCYPDVSAITVTETKAEIQLQALLNHTANRLVYTQQEVMASLKPSQLMNLSLITKWGFDGSSGQSKYKQKFEDQSDASIFLTSMVPLRLIQRDPENQQELVLWKNPRPSSPRYCRPIRFQFIQESAEISKKEMNYIENQIVSLEQTSFEVNGIPASIKHILLFTMIDGKVCNAVTDTTSTLKCFICGVTPKDFNNVKKILSLPIDDDVSKFRFGLSILHAWIRFFECLLHLAYKLPIQKWQARGKDSQEIVKENKKRIQDQFQAQLGLLVDFPKPNYGNTNDGNTARRFFQNISVSSQITGISQDIIKRFHIILQTISSGHHIHVDKFRFYALETAKLFIKLYPWYKMAPTVHKILFHGPEVIESALLPIGELSEEAQEAKNKDVKMFRRGFSRKASRIETNTDILNMLLISSDPYISSLRNLPKRKLRNFSSEALELLIPPNIKNVIENQEAEAQNEDEIETDEDSEMQTDDEDELETDST